MNNHIEEARRLVAEWERCRAAPRDTKNWTNLSDAEDRLSSWAITPKGPSHLLATIDAQAAEIERLRALLPQTADGINLADCPALYCPECGGKVLQYDRCCVCENCGTDEDGPWELGYAECLSKPKGSE